MVRFPSRGGSSLSCLMMGLVLVVAKEAHAGGWQKPSRGVARHQALSGATIGGIEDPTAALYNPAGLSGVEEPELVFGLQLGLAEFTAPGLQAYPFDSGLSPGWNAHGSFAVGLTEWMSWGVGIFPVLSKNVSYRSTDSASAREDRLKMSLTEFGPTFCFHVPAGLPFEGLSAGIGYRLTFGSLRRTRGSLADPEDIDLSLKGFDAAGLRVGLQYRLLPELRWGVVMRSKMTVDASSEEGVVLGRMLERPTSHLSLPLMIGTGLRFDIDRVGVAMDYSYSDTSEVDLIYRGLEGGEELSVTQIAGLRDSHQIRAGLEYRLPLGAQELPLRAGYSLETAVGTSSFPSAFGPLGARIHGVSLGAGLLFRSLSLNMAAEARFGAGDSQPASIDGSCDLCGPPGRYSTREFFLGLDAGWNFGR